MNGSSAGQLPQTGKEACQETVKALPQGEILEQVAQTKEKIARLHIRMADARNDNLHKVSIEIQQKPRYSRDGGPAGKENERIGQRHRRGPGCNVRQKAGVNKAIIDQGVVRLQSHTYV